MYKDGGSLAIKCFGYPNEDSKMVEFEICLDGRFETGDSRKYKGFWIGYPDKPDSFQITDSETINIIKNEVQKFHKYLTYRVEEILKTN